MSKTATQEIYWYYLALHRLDLPGLNWLITVLCWWDHKVKKKIIVISSILFWGSNFSPVSFNVYIIFIQFKIYRKKLLKHTLPTYSLVFLLLFVFSQILLFPAHLNRFYNLYFYKTFWTERLLAAWVGICRYIFQLFCQDHMGHPKVHICLAQSVVLGD